MNRKKRAGYPGPEIIAELVTVLEVEPAELLKDAPRGKGEVHVAIHGNRVLISRDGRGPIAAALAARCRMPPLSSCG